MTTLRVFTAISPHGGMEPGAIVEALDEGEDIALGLGSSFILAPMNEFGLEGMKEALHQGIAVAVGFAAH
jgi:hypothetical protein